MSAQPAVPGNNHTAPDAAVADEAEEQDALEAAADDDDDADEDDGAAAKGALLEPVYTCVILTVVSAFKAHRLHLFP